MKNVLSTIALGASVLLAAGGLQAANTTYRATLSGPAESPPNASPGSGIAVFDVDPSAMSLSMRIPFMDLTSGTTVAHIHCCTTSPLTGDAIPATTVPSLPAFPVGVMAGLYMRTLNLDDAASYNPAFVSANGGTVGSAATALMSGIAGHRSYFNVHTANYPDGEVRGFLVAAPVPEPASWAMLGFGLAGLGLMARRRRS